LYSRASLFHNMRSLYTLSDAILRLLSELHRECHRPLLVAYVDIKSVSNSVDREALWKAIRGTGAADILWLSRCNHYTKERNLERDTSAVAD